MDEKWQAVIATCEKLSQAAGVPPPQPPQPPANGPVGREWADPWLREARRLDWLTGWLGEVAVTLAGKPAKKEKATGG